MFAQIFGGAVFGLNGILISVEVDTANGLPSIELVGLPDASVREAKERVRSAIKNSGFEFPMKRVTINLAPAHIRKESSGLDLPIAVGILTASGQLPGVEAAKQMFCAELSLDGRMRGVAGVLSMILTAREQEIEEVFVAPENVAEALLVGDLQVYSAENLSDIAAHLSGEKRLVPQLSPESVLPENQATKGVDFSEIFGQTFAKRALQIAAAGGHNILLVGPPGSGKTLLARSLPSILPPLSEQEALEVTKIYSISGMLQPGQGLMRTRPFRSPHHTISPVGLIGGGRIPKPGEVTLSHHGVLFLDELPEFSREALEVLRQPLEDGEVNLTRAHSSMTYPASIMLICSLNPCPCGPKSECVCTPQEIRRYHKRISGPLLDRIDLHLSVPKLQYQEISNNKPSETSSDVKERVIKARNLQKERLQGWGIYCNAKMGRTAIRQTCQLNRPGQELVQQAFDRLNLSGRSYDRLLKVARTIADLEASPMITERHVAEAIQFRSSITELS